MSSTENHYGILADWQIAELCQGPNPMISPFVDHSVKANDKNERIISYGLSSFGYDARVAPEFKVFTNVHSTIVDPKDFNPKNYVEKEGDYCIIPPNSFILTRTLDRFSMPEDVVGICVGKSTIARVGINCLVTPLEPGWEGYLTLEFANTTPSPAKIYANEGGLQIQFFRGARPSVTYRDRSGKYQGQAAEIVLPKV
jgi:dCTP deaminase